MSPSENKREVNTQVPKRRDSQRSQLQGRGTDQDLPLKIEMRRLLWRMGCSVRLDVRLRTYIPKLAGASGAQDLTDLDVLGIGFTPGGQLHTTFADCRSNSRGVMERMFWVKGVATFVDADDAYMVRASAVAPGARSLAARLNVGVVTNMDFKALESTFPTELSFDGALACLFDREAVARHLDVNINAHRDLAGLLNYLEFDYWILEPFRNLTQMVARLGTAAKVLDPGNYRHRALLYDCAWHYALSIARAVSFVRSTRASDVPTAVRTYVGGGEQSLREKAGLAHLLQSAGIDVGDDPILPPYFDALVDLVGRHIVRPTEAASVLRYLEYLAVSEASRIEATLGSAFGDHVSPIAAKLVVDSVAFLVSAAGLHSGFKVHVRERTLVDLTGGIARSAADISAEQTGAHETPDLRYPSMDPLIPIPGAITD